MNPAVVFIILFIIQNQKSLAHVQSRIINGYIGHNQHPHHAIIQYLNEENAGLIGGGSLISNQHILTAAQIIQEFVRWKIGVGSRIQSDLRYIESTKAIFHPDFDPQTLNNDIGIIFLPHLITFSSDILPIPLPNINHSKTPLENEEGIIIGFGEITQSGTTSSHIREGFQRVISDKRCRLIYPSAAINQFCAENVIDKVNVCSGDIGGGFTIFSRRREVLVGITSKVYRFCDAKEPSGYTRISQYRKWILDIADI